MTYIVRSGDTLSTIAERQGVTLAALLAANPTCRGNPNRIYPGQTLNIAPAAPPKPTPPPSTGSGPAGAAAPICEAALQLIVMFEISSPQEYRLHYQAPSWPEGESGITIGIGYDLGYVSAAQFRADWGNRLDGDTAGRLAAVCGLTGPAAQARLAGLADIAVPWAMAEDIFRRRTVPAYAARTAEALPNTGRLPPDCFGALVSLVYNRGAAFAAEGDRWREMRDIHAAMAAEAFAGIPAAIRSMKRLWEGAPGMAGLLTRREREAQLFERGLALAAAGAPLSPADS
jgi:uncharacterized membrane protein